jgi:hypothetical protein
MHKENNKLINRQIGFLKERASEKAFANKWGLTMRQMDKLRVMKKIIIERFTFSIEDAFDRLIHARIPLKNTVCSLKYFTGIKH